MFTKISRIVCMIGALAAGASMLALPAFAEETGSAVTFNKDVLPILQKNCQSCHRPGQIGPFSMLSYKDTRPWAKAIKFKQATVRILSLIFGARSFVRQAQRCSHTLRKITCQDSPP